jgi:hypothetical protein
VRRSVCGLGAITSIASASVLITEVDPFGSNAGTGYVADWFELTNTGSGSVSIGGLSMVDSRAASNASAPYSAGATISIGSNTAAALTLAGGVNSLGAGQSAIFLESNSNAAGSATLIANFESAWFGSNVPAGLLIGTYEDGGSFGLSQTADMVNIFSGASTTASPIASVAFGADAGTPVATFDNAAGLNNSTVSTRSAVGVDGAFLAKSGLEIGSPDVAPVPLPAAAWLLMSGLGACGFLGRRRAS